MNNILKTLWLTFIIIQTILSSSHAQDQVMPCKCCSEFYRQFDFWIGNWDVYTGEKLAGTNSVTILQDSCLIRENWVSSGGKFTGTSYNFYNPAKEQWEQLWIDNQGGSLELSGKLESGAMRLYSDPMKNQEGENYINRITWTPHPDGSVRQHWEISKNDGKSWQTIFDGLYKRQ